MSKGSLIQVEAATDRELEALAKNDGYFGILLVPQFLAKKNPSLHHFLDHLQYVIEIMGIDKVGVGTDWGSHPELLVYRWNEYLKTIGFRDEHKFDFAALPEGWKDWGDWPNITCGLVSRGYCDKEIKGILGGNFLRIFEKVVG